MVWHCTSHQPHVPRLAASLSALMPPVSHNRFTRSCTIQVSLVIHMGGLHGGLSPLLQCACIVGMIDMVDQAWHYRPITWHDCSTWRPKPGVTVQSHSMITRHNVLHAGVHGRVPDLARVIQRRHNMALAVVMGTHMESIIVDTEVSSWASTLVQSLA